MRRTEFLARVRDALDAESPGGSIPDAPEVDESLIRLGPDPADRVRVFAEKAVEAGMLVHQCTPVSLVETLRELLIHLGAAAATTTVTEGPIAQAVRDATDEADCKTVDWHEAPGLDAHFDVDVGITDVAGAIAETGTLVLETGPQRSRGTHLVPPAHVAIVTRSVIVCDMIDYWAALRARPSPVLPSCSVLISGPSKTADIEGILITGVHGPGIVHVLLVDDEA